MLLKDQLIRLRALSKFKTVRINVATCQLDALLLKSPSCEKGHRGVWCYSTEATNGVEVSIGDRVEFILDGQAIQTGIVTELFKAEQFPKWCSRLNSKVFRWVDEPQRIKHNAIK